MKAHFTIYLKIGEEEVNLSPYLSKNSVSFNSNLCSTGWKSVTDTASMTLTFNDRNVARLQEILAYLVSAQQAFPPVAVNVRIAQGDTTVFRGKLDLGKLSVSSSKLPGTISLSAKSRMEELDVKPQNNFALWPGTVGDAVNRCLQELSLPSVSSWAPGIEKRGLEVPFVVTEDDSDTWRNRIDTLLCEMGGYVLTYDHATDTFAVSKVNDPDKEVPETFVRYLVSSQLKSGSTRFSKDGVVVIYRNVKSEPDQIMYQKDISYSKDEATGDTVGEWVEPGAFFPEDADITKTFEEYNPGILDRENLLKTSRKQNDHMGLYFLDPDTTKIEITASDENYKGVSNWYSNDSFYSPEGGFTYPKGGEFYPTKAWIALKNKTEGKINVTDFRISGKVWYSDAEYRMVMPIACKDPEEYSSSYISKQETAKEYANFLMNIKRFGGDTSTWTERWEEHSIGDKVLIRHKSGSTITAVIVRKQTRIMGDELWADMTAVSLDGWRLTEDSGVETSTKGVSVFDEYGQAKLNGYTGTKEQWLARNDLYYIWSSSETELKPRSRGFWRLGGKWMLYGGRAVGDFLAQDWEKNWTEVMNERSETYRYLWAKVGEDGEPFLFQGVSAADFSVIVSPSSYTINPRSLTPYKVNLKISRLNNLKGISDLVLNNTYQSITLEKLGEDEWEVTIEQRMNTPLRFSFTASVNDASKGYTVTGTRIMAENACIGYFTDSPPLETEQRFLDGDTCLVNGIPYKFGGSSWQEITTIEEFESLPYELAVSTGDCMLGSGDVTESMAVMWAYFGHIFSRSATIDRIRTSRITMEGNGIIKSKNVADSEIGSKYLTSKGYALSGNDGLIQTNGGWFSNAHVQGSLEMGSSSGIHFQALEDDGSGKSKFVIANADKDLLWIGEDGRLHAVMENIMAQTVSGENVNGNEKYTDINGDTGSCYYSTSDFFVLSHNTRLRKITASVMYDGIRGLLVPNYGVELLTYRNPTDSSPSDIYRSPWMANMTLDGMPKMAVLEIDLDYPVLLFKIRLRYGGRAFPYANLSAYYDITNI